MLAEQQVIDLVSFWQPEVERAASKSSLACVRSCCRRALNGSACVLGRRPFEETTLVVVVAVLHLSDNCQHQNVATVVQSVPVDKTGGFCFSSPCLYNPNTKQVELPTNTTNTPAIDDLGGSCVKIQRYRNRSQTRCGKMM